MDLSMQIGNFQRKIMLGGIDQLKQIEQMSHLIRMAEAQGVDTRLTTNFRGKDILDALQNVKLETDRRCFQRQTYEEYLADPFGASLKDQRALEDESIQRNNFNMKMQDKLIENMATSLRQEAQGAQSTESVEETEDDEDTRKKTLQMKKRSV